MFLAHHQGVDDHVDGTGKEGTRREDGQPVEDELARTAQREARLLVLGPVLGRRGQRFAAGTVAGGRRGGGGLLIGGGDDAVGREGDEEEE